VQHQGAHNLYDGLTNGQAKCPAQQDIKTARQDIKQPARHQTTK
jgi:hypothetical protein